MKSAIRNLVKKISPGWYYKNLISKKLLHDKSSFLMKSGWYNSLVSQKPLDTQGHEIPWMNYGIIDFLESRLNNKMTVFEYGSGASTLYFAKKVKS